MNMAIDVNEGSVFYLEYWSFSVYVRGALRDGGSPDVGQRVVLVGNTRECPTRRVTTRLEWWRSECVPVCTSVGPV